MKRIPRRGLPKPPGATGQIALKLKQVEKVRVCSPGGADQSTAPRPQAPAPPCLEPRDFRGRQVRSPPLLGQARAKLRPRPGRGRAAASGRQLPAPAIRRLRAKSR